MKRAPGPGTLGLLRRLRAAKGDMRAALSGLARDHGDVVQAGGGPARLFLLSHPDQVRDVLVTHDDRFERVPSERRVSGRIVHGALFASEGAAHARQRARMEPVMYGDLPGAQAAIVADHAGRMADAWTAGQTVDVERELDRTTTGMITAVAFGADVREPLGARIARALANSNAALNRLPLAPTGLADTLPLPSVRRFRRRRAELEALLDDVIDERIRSGVEGTDVVSLLLRSSAGDGPMSRTQARDEAVGLYRGQLGAPAALSWTWYLLEQNPDQEARMHREIDEVLGGRPPAFEDLGRLEHTRRVFREALRLYPTAWVIARRAVEDHPVGDVVIPAGSRVLLSQWIVQRDARFWDEPERFDPDRFLPEREAARHPFAYFPQSAGSKRCMGMDLLPVVAVATLAEVGRRWRLRVAPGHTVAASPKVTLRPVGGMPMVPERRG